MKRDKLLSAMFTSRTVRFDDVVTLLTGLGFACKKEAAGSRVRFVSVNGKIWAMHKPHPGNELKPYQIAQLREFLKTHGFQP